jgi:hypothetical protein
MAHSRRVAAWNANGIKNHVMEIEHFLMSIKLMSY